MQSQSAGDSCFLTLRPLSLGLLRTPEDLPHHSTQKSFCLDSPVSHPLWRNPTQLFPAMPNNTSPWHLCQPTSQLPDPQNEPLPSLCSRGPSECLPATCLFPGLDPEPWKGWLGSTLFDKDGAKIFVELRADPFW